MHDFFIFFVYFFFLERTRNKFSNKKKRVDISILFHVMNFWILNCYTVFWNSNFFLENYKYELIILGGCGFLQKNTFSKPFQEKNWNKGVLQQFKA